MQCATCKDSFSDFKLQKYWIAPFFGFVIRSYFVWTGCWISETRRSPSGLLRCLPRCVIIFGGVYVCVQFKTWSDAHCIGIRAFAKIIPIKAAMELPLFPNDSCLTPCLLPFRSPWRPGCTHRWRHPTWCSLYRENRHLRQHRGEGPADKKGCHTTRVRERWLEDHQSAIRGKFSTIISYLFSFNLDIK